MINTLRQNGAYVFKTVTTGKAGVPDVIACLNGLFIALEIKAGSKLTELQKYNINQIVLAGGIAAEITDIRQVELLVSALNINKRKKGIEK